MNIKQFSQVDGNSKAFKAGKQLAQEKSGISNEDLRKTCESLGFSDDDWTNFVFGYNCVDKKAEDFGNDDVKKNSSKLSDSPYKIDLYLLDRTGSELDYKPNINKKDLFRECVELFYTAKATLTSKELKLLQRIVNDIESGVIDVTKNDSVSIMIGKLVLNFKLNYEKKNINVKRFSKGEPTLRQMIKWYQKETKNTKFKEGDRVTSEHYDWEDNIFTIRDDKNNKWTFKNVPFREGLTSVYDEYNSGFDNEQNKRYVDALQKIFK